MGIFAKFAVATVAGVSLSSAFFLPAAADLATHSLGIADAQANCSVSVSGSTAKIYQVGNPTGKDTTQLQCAIDRAISDLESGAASSATVLLKANAMYIVPPVPGKNAALFIRTSDLSKHYFGPLTFNGQGATLALASSTTGLYINGCKSCTLENFTVRTSPSPLREGLVTSVGSGYVDVRLTDGSPFSLQSGWRSPVGKNTNVVDFLMQESAAFPNKLQYPAKYPYASLTSAVARSSQVDRLILDDALSIFPTLVANKTIAALIDPPIDPSKDAAVTKTLTDATALRTQYPEYGPLFFVGQLNASIHVEENTDLLLKSITVTEYHGSALTGGFNRGSLTVDGFRIIPASMDGLRSIAAGGMSLRNNQTGPVIKNSEFIYPGDDSIELVAAPFGASVLTGRTGADLLFDGPLLQSSNIEQGDRMRLINATTGSVLGTLTVAMAVPYVAGATGGGWHVAFTSRLPAGITLTDSDAPTMFVDLDQSNAGEIVKNNLFVGGIRNNILFVPEPTTITDNVFIGSGLWPIIWNPISVPGGKHDNGLVGDFGPVIITNNIAIDTSYGFLRETDSGAASPSFSIPVGHLTLSDNTIIAPLHPTTPFNAIYINTPLVPPTTANGNSLVLSDTDTRTNGMQFIAGKNISAWQNAFLTPVKKSASGLWAAKCAAIPAQWQRDLEEVAPGSCKLSDIQIPAVAWVSPVRGATLSGVVRLVASSTDNVGVVGVSFGVDGSPVGTADASTPYSSRWNTTNVQDGPHKISAVANDAAGNSATSTIEVAVVNPAMLGPWSASGAALAHRAGIFTLKEDTTKAKHFMVVPLKNVGSSATIKFLVTAKRLGTVTRDIALYIYNPQNGKSVNYKVCTLPTDSAAANADAQIITDASTAISDFIGTDVSNDGTLLQDDSLGGESSDLAFENAAASPGWQTCAITVKPDNLSGPVRLQIRLMSGKADTYKGDGKSGVQIKGIGVNVVR